MSEASKLFAKKFSCGCAVVKSNMGEEIVIQGDYTTELVNMLKEKWQVRFYNDPRKFREFMKMMRKILRKFCTD